MKKLLSILGSVAIAASISAPVVSCTNSATNYANREAKFYSEVSAQAFKSAILNDQNLLIGSNSTSIDYKYSSDYYGNQKIKDVFKNFFPKYQGANVDPSDPVYMLYNTVFGGHPVAGFADEYNISKSFSDLKAHSGVKEGTNLWKLVNGIESNIGVEPDQKTADMISAASGAAQTVFGNDFSSSMASTAINMLSSTTVENALNSKDILAIFKQIDGILSQNTKGISSILTSLTQENVDQNITLGQQLANSTQQLFQGLIYLISQNKFVYTGDISKSANVFWDFILNGNTGALTPTTQSTDNLLTSISQMVPFAMTLIHYFRSFDSVKLSTTNIENGDLLFDSQLTNAQYKKTILNEEYVDKTSDYWYWDNDKHYMKLNLQNLFSDLQYYFSPVDLNGYQTLRAWSILLGGVDSGDTDPALNPIVDTALSPLLEIALSKVNGMLDSLAGVPLIGDYVPKLKDAFAKLLGSASSQLFEWLSTDGAYKDGATIVQSSLHTIQSALSFLTTTEKEYSGLVPDEYKNILDIVLDISDYLNSSNGENFIKNPWRTFYRGGMLKAIASNRFFKFTSDDRLREMAYGLGNLKDFKNILSSMTGDQLLDSVGHLVGTQLSLPDWLYEAKDLTISKILRYVSSIYKTTGLNTLEQNQNYSLSTEALKNIVSSLLPNTNNDPNNILIVGTDGKTAVSPIMPIYYSIVYYNSADVLTGDNDFGDYQIKLPGDTKFIPLATSKPGDTNPNKMKTNVNSDALNYLFGIARAEDGTTSFSKGSVFYAISQLYGHNYSSDNKYEDMANGAESLFTLLSRFGDFAESSVSQLVSDNYAKYFDPKNWLVKNIRQLNLDNESNDSDITQQLDYDIVFKNPYTKKASIYHVTMTRTPYTNGGIWKLDKLLLMN